MELVLWHVGGVTLHKTVLDCTVSGLGCTVWGKREMAGMAVAVVVILLLLLLRVLCADFINYNSCTFVR
jgi:hypothetical protein